MWLCQALVAARGISDLPCSMQDLIVAPCELLVVACDKGLNSGPLHWERRVLATGPPRRFWSTGFHFCHRKSHCYWWCMHPGSFQFPLVPPVAEWAQQKISSFPIMRAIPSSWWCLQFFFIRSGCLRFLVSGSPCLLVNPACKPPSPEPDELLEPPHPQTALGHGARHAQSDAAKIHSPNPQAVFVQISFFFPFASVLTCLFVLFVRAYLPYFSVSEVLPLCKWLQFVFCITLRGPCFFHFHKLSDIFPNF